MEQLKYILRNEKGYTINKVFATSFTFSTLYMSELLLRIAAYNTSEIERGTSCQKKLALKREIAFQKESQKLSQKLLVLVHDFEDSEQVPDELINGANIYLKRFLVANQDYFIKKIKVDNGGFFHPKLVLVELKNPNGEYKYRLLVSSKNLVRDNYFQLGMYFESASEENNRPCMDTASLCGFIEEMAGKCSEQEEYLKSLKYNLNNVKLIPVGNGIDDIEEMELVFGMPNSYIEGKEKKQGTLLTKLKSDFENKKRWDIITDSISYNFLGNVTGKPDKNCIRIVDNEIRWLEQEPSVQDSEAKLDIIKEKCTPLIPSEKDPYWHAKVLAASDGCSQIVWVGSANFTNNAFTNNYECCVRYKIKSADLDTQGNNLEIYGLNIPEQKELHSYDLEDAKKDEQKQFADFLEIMKKKICIGNSEVNVKNHTITFRVKAAAGCIIFDRNKNKFYWNNYWIESVVFQLPLGYGRTDGDINNLFSQKGAEIEIKYKKGSISGNGDRVIISFELKCKGQGNHTTRTCSLWKTLNFSLNDNDQWEELRNENMKLRKEQEKGAGLFRGELPKLSDAIPLHERAVDTDNAELLVATYLGINQDDNPYDKIKDNISVLKESIEKSIEESKNNDGIEINDEIEIEEYESRKKLFEEMYKLFDNL